MLKVLLRAVLCSAILLCSGRSFADSSEQNPDELGLENVVLQLKWKHAFQFAGYYTAAANGYYREAGLHVEIREAGQGIDPVLEVVEGRANFGVGDSSIVIARSQGNPVVVLGVIFQHSAITLLALRHGFTQTIHALSGKRIMLVPSSYELRAYLQKVGLGPDSYQAQDMSFDIQDLVKGNTDAFSAYITDQPHTLERNNIPFVAFSPRSAGIDFYGDNLFSSETEIQLNRKRVEAFRDASMRGWEYAMAHPNEAVELILKQYPSERDKDSLRYEANQMEALLRPDLVELGYMREGRWRHIVEVYAEIGMMNSDFSLKGFIYQEEQQSNRDLSWLYRLSAVVLLSLLLVAYVALRFYRLSRALASDIEARKKAELEKSELESQLLHSQKIQAIGTLAGGMAHDMNNVLAVVLGLGSVLKEDIPPDSEQYEDIRDIVLAAERGQSMVANLLGFARKGKYQVSKWQPNEGILQIESMLQKTLPKTIAINTDLRAARSVQCDSNQIVSALMNLCVNSAHALGEKGQITISSRDIDLSARQSLAQGEITAGSYVALTVQDNGKGMDEETRNCAFDPFFTTKDIGEGTGLGLSMVHGVVKNHKGSVTIESELGEGTKITITLPAVDLPRS